MEYRKWKGTRLSWVVIFSTSQGQEIIEIRTWRFFFYLNSDDIFSKCCWDRCISKARSLTAELPLEPSMVCLLLSLQFSVLVYPKGFHAIEWRKQWSVLGKLDSYYAVSMFLWMPI